VWGLRVFEHADLSEDFECWAQFDVHGSHEMVLLQQQKSLSVDLLRAELLGDLQTTCSRRATTVSLQHRKHHVLLSRQKASAQCSSHLALYATDTPRDFKVKKYLNLSFLERTKHQKSSFKV